MDLGGWISWSSHAWLLAAEVAAAFLLPELGARPPHPPPLPRFPAPAAPNEGLELRRRPGRELELPPRATSPGE
jgi:hypothetical protein